MVDKYFGGTLPDASKETEFCQDLITTATTMLEKVETNMDKLAFSEALNEIWNLVRRANKYIDETAPWVLAKDESKQSELATVLYNLSEVLRIVSIAIAPVMPTTPAIIREQLNFSEDFSEWESAKKFGLLPRDVKVTKGAAAFPRMDKTT
jgi:methionyl-tRNA synthetase